MNTDKPEELGPEHSRAALEYLNNEKLTKNESLFAAISWKLWDYTCVVLGLLLTLAVALSVTWTAGKCGLNDCFPETNFSLDRVTKWTASELLGSLVVTVVLYRCCKFVLKWKPGRSFALRSGLALYRCFR